MGNLNILYKQNRTTTNRAREDRPAKVFENGSRSCAQNLKMFPAKTFWWPPSLVGWKWICLAAYRLDGGRDVNELCPDEIDIIEYATLLLKPLIKGTRVN